MEIKIKVETTKLVGALLKAGSSSTLALRKEMGQQMERVQLDAKANHRFVTRGGMLERSIMSFVSNGGLIGRVYLAEGIAPYGGYIHDGTGIYGKHKKPIVPRVASALKWRGLDGRWHSAKKVRGWKPDRFIYQAFSKAAKDIKAGLTNAYKTVLKNGGLL